MIRIPVLQKLPLSLFSLAATLDTNTSRKFNAREQILFFFYFNYVNLAKTSTFPSLCSEVIDYLNGNRKNVRFAKTGK